MHADKPLTYISYLRLDELLALQSPRSQGPEHDEMLFIIIHQVYELWFKQLLHELDYLRAALSDNDAVRALATLKRVLTIFKTLVAQVDVLETMTPVSFNSFRSRLERASGFQSAQFRALEFALGYKRPGPLAAHAPDSPWHALLSRQLEQPSVWDAFLLFLRANGYEVPEPVVAARPVQPDERVQQALLSVYADAGFPMQVCELLVDLDEGVQEWRYRHVKMVERTIGSKPGTGGSPGVAYLRETLFRPLFSDLWEIRSRL